MENKTVEEVYDEFAIPDRGNLSRYDVILLMNRYASQQCLEKQKQLDESKEYTKELEDEIEDLEAQTESQQAEIDRLKEECDQFAMKFLEYASGLAISNYASGGTWYLNDGSFVSTYKILEQFKILER